MLTNLGPRVVGDIANEVYAPTIIENEILEAQSNAHSSQSILMKVKNNLNIIYHRSINTTITINFYICITAAKRKWSLLLRI